MKKISRRYFVKTGFMGVITAFFSSPVKANPEQTYLPTPSETEGPFYPVYPQKDKDFDLTVKPWSGTGVTVDDSDTVNLEFDVPNWAKIDDYFKWNINIRSPTTGESGTVTAKVTIKVRSRSVENPLILRNLLQTRFPALFALLQSHPASQ